MIRRRLADAAPPPRLTLLLWRPRRKLLLLNPPLTVYPLYGFVLASLCPSQAWTGRSEEMFHEQLMDLVVVGYTWTHLQTIKGKHFRRWPREWAAWVGLSQQRNTRLRPERWAECAHLKHIYQGLCPKLSQAQPDGGYSTLGTTAEDLTSLSFFNLIFIVWPLFILPYTIPLGQQETVGQKNTAPLVCIQTGQISQYLAAQLTFHMLYRHHESCRWCHAAPVLSIHAVSLSVHQHLLSFRVDLISFSSKSESLKWEGLTGKSNGLCSRAVSWLIH